LEIMSTEATSADGPPAPKRVQLSRAKGWRMPPNTVKVDRTTKWGNPFIVSLDGTRAQCVQWLELLLGGMIHMSSHAGHKRLIAYRETVAKDIGELRGKNLACWCRHDGPCHADVLLRLANAPTQEHP
jgi:hypothetical protein